MESGQDQADAGGLEELARGRFAAGDFDGAIELLQRAIAAEPGSTQKRANLGVALAAAGRFEEAIQILEQAQCLDPGSSQIAANLTKAYIDSGNSHLSAGRYTGSIPFYRKALEFQPGHRWVLNNLAIALQETGRAEEALGVSLRAVEGESGFVEGWYNLGRIYQDLGREEEAGDAFEQALSVRPEYAAARSNLAMTLHARGRFDEAVVEYRRAIESDSKYDDAQINIGVALRDSGRVDEAIGHYRKLLEVRPDLAAARWNLGITLLREGRLEEGFAAAEARRQIPRVRCDRTFAGAQWQGEDLKGRTILLHGEQGFGDVIQFIRYAPLVRGRGGRVEVLSRRELKRLFENRLGIDQVCGEGEALPEFDVHCPLLTLPLIFRTGLTSIPATVPYLSDDPSLIARWAERLGSIRGERRVGLTWAGNRGHVNDRQRSMRAELLEPLSRLPGVRFVSLQKPAPLSGTPVSLKLVDFTEDLTDFADTAALIANLDLVITVDTAVAHLAGAMGKPVWLMLAYVPDWRWMMGREDSPWYPTMRLFRQRAFGDWESVIEEVVAAASTPASQS